MKSRKTDWIAAVTWWLSAMIVAAHLLIIKHLLVGLSVGDDRVWMALIMTVLSVFCALLYTSHLRRNRMAEDRVQG
jgi:hypothetical protein